MSKYFSYDDETGFDTHDTAEDAKAACEGSIDFYRENACGEGWDEAVLNVCWGEITQSTEETERRAIDPERDACSPEEFDHIADYGLRPLAKESGMKYKDNRIADLKSNVDKLLKAVKGNSEKTRQFERLISERDQRIAELERQLSDCEKAEDRGLVPLQLADGSIYWVVDDVVDGYETLRKKIADFEKKLLDLDDLIRVQSDNITTKYNRGLANGLICAKATLTGTEPKYLEGEGV